MSPWSSLTSRLRALPKWAWPIVALVGLYLILLIGWTVDNAMRGDSVARGVEVGGRDVGGQNPTELTVTVDALADELAAEPVEITTPKGTISTDTTTLTVAVDVDATRDSVDGSDDDGFLLARPVRWVASFFGSKEATLELAADPAAVAAALAAEPAAENQPVAEPRLVATEDGLAVQPGENGEFLDVAELISDLETLVNEGRRPLAVEVGWETQEPSISEAAVEELAAQARELMAKTFDADVRGVALEVPGEIFVAAFRSSLAGDGVVLTLDSTEAKKAIENYAAAGTDVASQGGSFIVEGGVPQVVLPEDPQTCCSDAVMELLLPALRGEGESPVVLPLRPASAEEARAELDALGIVEQVGSFTTNHQGGESRVTNIHRIADLIRGVVIRPGRTFSINDFVGPRTTEEGFVEAGVIVRGVFEESVGGGISQFATTTFNAAFFAGLDFGEYQSHSIYISRYPYGREATLSYPNPDLQLENTTEYGVLIWPTYTDTSITVTLYSTKHITVEQTGQSERPQGVCTRVTTARRRTYPDGEVVNDEVFALYRPEEGRNCDGTSNLPPTTTTTSTTVPPTSAPPPPSAPPPTAAPTSDGG